MHNQQELSKAAAIALQKDVEALLDVVVVAAAGNLTAQLPECRDEAVGKISEGLENLFQSLRTTFAQIADAAAQLAGSSE